MTPEWFGPAAIDPETSAINADIEAFLNGRPHLTEVDPVDARRARAAGDSVFGDLARSESAWNRPIPGPDGDIPIRCLVPDDPRGVYVHIHGGGWVLGDIDQQDARLEALARTCRLTVVSVGYRLAPEHPFPAARDDCEAAALWLIGNADTEFGTDRLLIGGESAGAHLAATTLIRLRDRHQYQGFTAANLVYGVFDLRLTPSARNWGSRRLVLDTASTEWFIAHYAGGANREDPDLSPLLADLTALPPALFTVGTADPLLDDTLFMYSRWVAAGNRAELAVHPGASHAFDAFPTRVAHAGLERMYAFLGDQLDLVEDLGVEG